ncbi:MAG: histone deacetylase, partial [Desulfobulbus sp.]|nr:histone deacetylase [Desulfobulbus sp.]
VNVPLSSGHGDEEYARIFNQLICPLARSYRPQLILVSCGFDLMADDPIGMMRVTPAGVAYMTRVLCELAEELCAGKILCVLEGGYNHTNMKNGVLAVLSELGGVFQNCDFQDWLTPRFELRLRKSAAHSADVDLAIRHHGRWWDLGG